MLEKTRRVLVAIHRQFQCPFFDTSPRNFTDISPTFPRRRHILRAKENNLALLFLLFRARCHAPTLRSALDLWRNKVSPLAVLPLVSLPNGFNSAPLALLSSSFGPGFSRGYETYREFVTHKFSSAR